MSRIPAAFAKGGRDRTHNLHVRPLDNGSLKQVNPDLNSKMLTYKADGGWETVAFQPRWAGK